MIDIMEKFSKDAEDMLKDMFLFYEDELVFGNERVPFKACYSRDPKTRQLKLLSVDCKKTGFIRDVQRYLEDFDPGAAGEASSDGFFYADTF